MSIYRGSHPQNKWAGRSAYIATPNRHIYRERWEEKTTPNITGKRIVANIESKQETV